ncbi:MAG: prepilin-type N-terminal cleavage/methylation domain-containing protein [Pirellulales bacterium]|nr:prepilin-type N-terminal cleavage/methylation domain-containing protein [Pirellulales bacterium]
MKSTVGQVSNLSSTKRQVKNLSYQPGAMPTLVVGMLRDLAHFPHAHDERGHGTLFRSSGRSAFTLLEVMLALAILAAALAVLGEFARMGLRSAKAARDLTRAELLCESIMSEITAGITPPDPVENAPVVDPVTGSTLDEIQTDDVAPWIYSIDVQSIDEDGLLAVKVTVAQELPPAQRPASFSLVRWMPDPMLDVLYGSAESGSSSTQSTGTTP